MSGSTRPWRLRVENRDTLNPENIATLKSETGLSELTLGVAWLRGLHSAEQIRNFLNPALDTLQSPFKLDDMKKAVDRLVETIKLEEKVRVFGDYDVDGTAGAALLSWVFRSIGLNFDATQPDRFRDGYGLNKSAVEKAAADGVKVLITVDCGISSFDAIDRAKELDLDVIVLDHHQIDPERGLPKAFAIVNPQRGVQVGGGPLNSDLRELCGCGVAFYFSRALRSTLNENGFFTKERPAFNLRQHLDLVVLATAADMVPLIGENHILVRHGMEVLKTSSKPGVRALLRAAGVEGKSLGPSHLGFVLGPRINASGRMQNAQLALRLLTTQDLNEATELAQQLEVLNAERMEVQNTIWDDVQKQIEAGRSEGKFQDAIVIWSENFHEGVVGIVASRIVDRYHVPAAVVAIRDGVAKGSVRSFAHKDVLTALRMSSGFLLGFGGHVHAAGFSLDPSNLFAFAESFENAIRALPAVEDQKPLWMDDWMSLDRLNVEVLEELEQLGPFGPGNPEPLFGVRAQVESSRVLKERHIKLTLSSVESRENQNKPIEAIWFYALDTFEGLRSSAVGSNQSKLSIECIVVPEVNRFRGQVKPSLRVKDARHC